MDLRTLLRVECRSFNREDCRTSGNLLADDLRIELLGIGKGNFETLIQVPSHRGNDQLLFRGTANSWLNV